MIPSFLINHILTFVQLAHVLYMLLMALLSTVPSSASSELFSSKPHRIKEVTVEKSQSEKLETVVFPCMNIHGKTIYKAYKARFKVNIWFNHHLYSAHQRFS